MIQRVAIAVLWFFAAGWGWNLLALATGLPTFPGIVLGFATAALVLLASSPGVGSVARRHVARPTADRAQAPTATPDRLRA